MEDKMESKGECEKPYRSGGMRVASGLSKNRRIWMKGQGQVLGGEALIYDCLDYIVLLTPPLV